MWIDVDWQAERLLEHPGLPVALARQILDRPDVLLPGIHRNLNARPEVLGLFSEYATGDDLLLLAAEERTPATPLVTLLRSCQAPIPTLIADPQTPETLLMRLIGNVSDLNLIQHPNTGPGMLKALLIRLVRSGQLWSTHVLTWVETDQLIEAVLNHRASTTEVVEAIVDPRWVSSRVRALVAKAPETPAGVLTRLAQGSQRVVAPPRSSGSCEAGGVGHG